MELHEVLCRVSMLEGLGEPERKTLATHAALRTLKRREAAWESGVLPNDFTFVLEGRVKLVKTNEQGRETIIDIVLPGQLLCPRAACTNLAYCCDAVAMDDATLLVDIPRAKVYGLMQASSSVIEALLREASCRSAGLCRRVEELASGQVDRRIATLLIRLAEQIGRQEDQGLLIPVGLSRQDLADMCGTTVETTIRSMSRFKRLGIVTSASPGFRVHDMGRLKDIARGTVD